MSFEFSIFITAFAVVFLAEIGDKTQLVAFSLTSTSRSPVVIFIATSLALSLSGLMASLLGGLAKQILPDFTAYIASGLFFVFGFYILLSKEPPNIREWFLKTVSFESSLMHHLPQLFKKYEKYDARIIDIVRQESSHANVFRTLLKERTLFKDDINEDEQLESLQKGLDLPKDLMRKPFAEAVTIIIEKEKTVRDIYASLRDHLQLEHHNEATLCSLLGSLVEEENTHIKLFEQIKQESAP
ncbi:MAG: TMEM165/GDT1 family protein [Spirochaetales bacterium]|nr:TMEM165/GDT1 family protein [Spirochaetales bacterium]